MRQAALLLAMLVPMALSGAAAQAEQRVALVIGNSAYERLSPLSNPANDAALIAASLRRPEVGFEVIEEVNLDRRGMARAVLDFANRIRTGGPDAVGLFYYAGHGVQAQGHNFLIPIGAPINAEADLEIEAISAGWVLRQMEAAGNRLNLIVLDACRNNPYAGGFRSGGRGLARMDAPRGSMLAYAAGPGQVAEDGAGSNSPYTAALAKVMLEPGLKAEDVFKRVRVEVERLTGGSQTPWEESSLTGDFYFHRPADEPQQPVPSAAVGLTSPDAQAFLLIKESRNPRDFETFIKLYPDSPLVPFARNRLEALGAETEVAALPAAQQPAQPLEAMDRTFVALGRTSVRAQPSTTAEQLGQLHSGDRVRVTGKLADGTWLQVTLTEGGAGFVYAPLLQDEETWNKEHQVASTSPGETQVAVGVYGRPAAAPLRDCAHCPELVAVPAGRFSMGSPDREPQRDAAEGPQHAVVVRGFALGRYEVTRAEFSAFVEATGREPGTGCWTHESGKWVLRAEASWRNAPFAQGDREPVVCVSWQDAQAYVEWLSDETDESYRLASEAEWEYAARAGTTGARFWGEAEGEVCSHANGADLSAQERFPDWLAAGCRDGFVHTAPVGSFAANFFGLHDMLGNVWEWVEDCWHDGHAGAPSDGRARAADGGACRMRVLRGGSWDDKPEDLRSARRSRVQPGYRNDRIGFRVARALEGG